jgi:protein KRI1
MEIMEKIEKLKEVTGNSSLDFTENDIEEDFDAEQYDKMMKVNISRDTINFSHV